MLDQGAAVEGLRLIASLAARGPERRKLPGGNFLRSGFIHFIGFRLGFSLSCFFLVSDILFFVFRVFFFFFFE